MDYFLHVLVLVGIYTALAASLDLVAGHAGLLSLAHAGFYGVGAYASAVVTVRLGASAALGVLIGIALAALLSLAISLSSLRLHEDYFVIATFGFQVIVFSVLNNWADLTRGPLGIPGIPRPYFLGWEVRNHAGFIVLTAALAGFAYLVVWRIASSPFGRVLRAIREDEVLVKSLGKGTLRLKIDAFAVSAALAASAGSLYAHYITYIDPTSFTIMESVLVLSMVIIGGPASPWGPPVGATVLVTLPEALRFIGLPSSVAANLRQIFHGCLLVLMMLLRPRGLAGRYGFGR